MSQGQDYVDVTPLIPAYLYQQVDTSVHVVLNATIENFTADNADQVWANITQANAGGFPLQHAPQQLAQSWNNSHGVLDVWWNATGVTAGEYSLDMMAVKGAARSYWHGDINLTLNSTFMPLTEVTAFGSLGGPTASELYQYTFACTGQSQFTMTLSSLDADYSANAHNMSMWLEQGPASTAGTNPATYTVAENSTASTQTYTWTGATQGQAYSILVGQQTTNSNYALTVDTPACGGGGGGSGVRNPGQDTRDPITFNQVN